MPTLFIRMFYDMMTLLSVSLYLSETRAEVEVANIQYERLD